MLVEAGTSSTVGPERWGKALAVNLSDLAACGARPRALALALSRVSMKPGWRLLARAVSAGRRAPAPWSAATPRGPLNICITVFGEAPPGQMLRRDGAAGDDFGSPAGWATRGWRWKVRGRVSAANLDALRPAMEQPATRRPRPGRCVALPQAHRHLRRLAGDLGHILAASGVGARPRRARAAAQPVWRPIAAWQIECLLAGGDDYELVFTVPRAAVGPTFAGRAASPHRRHRHPGLGLRVRDEADAGAAHHLAQL